MEGLNEFEAAMRNQRAGLDAFAQRIVASDAAILVKTAQSNFQGSHRRGEPHVGGSFPNIVSGDLRRSIRSDPITRLGDGVFGTTVAPHMVYGRRVELGWQGSTPHAFFQPAVTSAREQIVQKNRNLARTYSSLLKGA